MALFFSSSRQGEPPLVRVVLLEDMQDGNAPAEEQQAGYAVRFQRLPVPRTHSKIWTKCDLLQRPQRRTYTRDSGPGSPVPACPNAAWGLRNPDGFQAISPRALLTGPFACLRPPRFCKCGRWRACHMRIFLSPSRLSTSLNHATICRSYLFCAQHRIVLGDAHKVKPDVRSLPWDPPQQL